MLTVDELSIGLVGRRGETIPVVDKAWLRIGEGETLGLVGESGSGKSMLCRSLVGTLYRHSATVTGGSILFEGTELTGASEAVWRSIRGHRIAYVPQSSLAGINPVLTVGTQLTALVRAARSDTGEDVTPRARVRELLELVEIPRIDSVMNERPHQLSGGMRQRVVIAGALARNPSLLIADEPTTALDVRVQARILDLLRRLREQLGMSLLLVSHDLAVVEEVCDSIVVLYAGAVLESGPQALVREQSRHPYTAGLVAARTGWGRFEPIPVSPHVGPGRRRRYPSACASPSPREAPAQPLCEARSLPSNRAHRASSPRRCRRRVATDGRGRRVAAEGARRGARRGSPVEVPDWVPARGAPLRSPTRGPDGGRREGSTWGPLRGVDSGRRVMARRRGADGGAGRGFRRGARWWGYPSRGARRWLPGRVQQPVGSPVSRRRGSPRVDVVPTEGRRRSAPVESGGGVDGGCLSGAAYDGWFAGRGDEGWGAGRGGDRRGVAAEGATTVGCPRARDGGGRSRSSMWGSRLRGVTEGAPVEGFRSRGRRRWGAGRGGAAGRRGVRRDRNGGSRATTQRDFRAGAQRVQAVEGANIDVQEREVVGLVGRAGAARPRSARCWRCSPADPGEVSYRGEPREMPRGGARSEVRGQVQMIFQDPYSSLNPKQRAIHAVAEVFGVWQGVSRSTARESAMALLREVGISEEQARLFPSSLSGGQRQRVSVARALAVEPRILIADEPTSSIDQSAQAQLLVLLGRLQTERGLGILLITHDLRLVRSFADRMYVMRRGELVESGPTKEIFSRPSHPYTQDLIEAVPGGMFQ